MDPNQTSPATLFIKAILKHCSRRQNQTMFVVIDALRVKITKSSCIVFQHQMQSHIPYLISTKIRGSFFMFVESGCISTNIEFTVP